MRCLLFCLFLSFSFFSFGQVPSVTFIDNPMGGNEEVPTLYPAADGGFFIVHTATKSSPDSIFAILTRLNASQVVQWSRVFKMRSSTNLGTLEEASDGSLTLLLNSYQTPAKYHPVLIKLSSTGFITTTTELMDSASTQMSPYYRLARLQNGNRLLVGSSSALMARITAAGNVDFSRQFYLGSGTNNPLYFSGGTSVPGTNQWYSYGYIQNTHLSFLLKMQDTTVVYLHVYDFNKANTTFGINNLYVFPNGEMIGAHVYNSTMLNLYRLNPNGGIIWRKNYKLPLTYPGKMTVDSNGDIWMHGSITPGQAGGILAHFSPTGNLIAHRTQNAGGVSLGNMGGFAQLPNNEYLTMQRGFYNSSSALIVNRIHDFMDFKCYNSNQYSFIDTTYAISDSATSQLRMVKRRIGAAPGLSFPILTFSPTVTSGTVICTPNATVEVEKTEPYLVFPNPAKENFLIQGLEQRLVIRIFDVQGRQMLEEPYSGSVSVEKLPAGMYWVEIAEKGLRKRFVKE